jgi:PPOX class probable F420-dependent enzyme
MHNLLTPPMRAFLAEPRFAVVGTLHRDGRPHMTVLWYELQEDVIVMNAERHRQKIYNLQRDSRLGFTVEDAYRYITITGTATLVYDQAIAQEDVRRMAIHYCGEVEGQRLFDEEYSREERVTIRMHMEHVYTFGFRPS